MKTLTTIKKLRKLLRAGKSSYRQYLVTSFHASPNNNGRELCYKLGQFDNRANTCWFDADGKIFATCIDGKVTETNECKWAVDFLNNYNFSK